MCLLDLQNRETELKLLLEKRTKTGIGNKRSEASNSAKRELFNFLCCW